MPGGNGPGNGGLAGGPGIPGGPGGFGTPGAGGGFNRPGGGAPGKPGGGGFGGGGVRGPDLSSTASDPAHTVEWFTKLIKNPKSVRGNARMPGFERTLKAADIKALAEFLASLK
jgi:mono/diheme cytochrome c family protein